MIVIAHLSDIHLDDGERSVERAARVLRYLAGLRGQVDVVLVTGDIADHGAVAEYERVREMLALPVPVLVLPGNHDAREPFRKVLLREPAGPAPINQVHRVGGAVFALCDSTIPGRDDGLLADETLAWLDATLAEAGAEPAFVCFHHHPVPVTHFVDSIRLFGEQRLAEVIARHPNVVAVLCGHAHTAAASTFAGVPVLVAPGVVSTLLLPWENGAVVDLDLPPGLAFHILHDDRRLTTHYRVVP
jgi:Icc protein